MPAMMAVDPTHTLAAASGDAWWLSEFRAFTWQHVLTSGTAILIMAGVSLLGRRWRRRAPARETALRRVWVGGVIALAALTITWWLLPANFDIQISLPLHVCDLAALLYEPIWRSRLGEEAGGGDSIYSLPVFTVRAGLTPARIASGQATYLRSGTLKAMSTY